VNPDHLFLGSKRDNVADMLQKGRRGLTGVRGALHARAKLTAADVAAIRTRRAKGERGIDLAREFHVSPPAIAKIHRGQRWSQT
jgi:hypothetical protein